MTTVTEVLARSPHVLLDFDGPLCSVFGGMTDRAVANELRAVLRRFVKMIPEGIDASPDPFDVLRYAAVVDSGYAEVVEQEFAHLELCAVATATETPGAIAAIHSLYRAGHTITIVSNNSASAVAAYIAMRGLGEAIGGISARVDADPSHLKPHPHLIQLAMQRLAARPRECVMIGDSVSDIQAAHAAGVASIGYANKAGKRIRLANERADIIIDEMVELAIGRPAL